MPNEFRTETESKKKGKSGWKYAVYILIVLVATGVSLGVSLWGDSFNQVVNAFKGAQWVYFAVILGLVAFSYCIEAMILLVFCRLYTRNYKFHQGLATSLIGQFYSNVTPGASGGQAMQVYTLKSQGIQVSNAASIMVMSFILYQTSLIIFDIVALAFEWNSVISINVNIPALGWHLPMWPLIIVGFLLNISVIFLLLSMSYSHHFHNFVLHYVIGFLAKIRLVKDPDATRESLRVQVENFKIELKRLASNIPVLVLQLIFYFIILMVRFSLPYFAAFTVNATGAMFDNGFSFPNMMRVSFLTSFHQMVTGLIPLPGSAGVSELFYALFFEGFFIGDGVLASSQIIWRTATFHILLLVCGFVAAFYRSRPKETIHYANRKTFVNLQLETYEERKRSADTLYETRSLSRKEIQRKMNELPHFHSNEEDEEEQIRGKMKVSRVKALPQKKERKAKPTRKKDTAAWEEWDI